MHGIEPKICAADIFFPTAYLMGRNCTLFHTGVECTSARRIEGAAIGTTRVFNNYTLVVLEHELEV